MSMIRNIQVLIGYGFIGAVVTAVFDKWMLLIALLVFLGHLVFTSEDSHRDD